jgi:hypothetical protein
MMLGARVDCHHCGEFFWHEGDEDEGGPPIFCCEECTRLGH